MKQKKLNYYCIISTFLIIMCFTLFFNEDSAKGEVREKNYINIPYETYTYSYFGEAEPSPHAYIPSEILSGSDMGVGNFSGPNGMFVDKKDNIYVADTHNNRIVILNLNDNTSKVIDNFKSNKGKETFKEPTDIFVTEQGELYIADSKNSRIVILNSEGVWIKNLEAPKSDLFERSFVYYPQKLVVDRAKRIYVIAKNFNQGIIELNPDGSFSSFVGSNKVIPDPIEYLWKMVSTKAQKESMMSFVPTEYNNIFGFKDFIYTTTSIIDANKVKAAAKSRNNKSDQIAPIKKMNLTGVDILIRDGYTIPLGDLQFEEKGSITGSSAFVDISVRDNGIYSALDQKRGRIFTYSPNGELLYIFGGIGEKMGNFKTPTAIECLKDGRILVLDSTSSTITLFENTYYENIITNAIDTYNKGNYKMSGEKWKECLKYNSNFDLAYVGTGRILFREGKYKEAMNYFKLGNNRELYSKALKLYQKEFIYNNIYKILGVILVLILIIRLLKRIKIKVKVVNTFQR